MSDKVWVVSTTERDAHDFPRLFHHREKAEAVLKKMGLHPVPRDELLDAWSFDGELSDLVYFLCLTEIE